MQLLYPLKGKSFNVTSGFGQRTSGNHKGIDLKADSGTPVVAIASGRVIKSDATSDPNGYGGQIVIRHSIDGETFYSKYAHLRKLEVTKNQSVSAGEQIGESGGGPNDPNRGRSTGPHLHFELLNSSSQVIDPTDYLKGATLLGGALLLGKSLFDKNEDDDDTSEITKNSSTNIVTDLLSGFNKIYTPIATLASLKGISTPQKESKLSKSILEEIKNFKRLIK